MTKRTAAAAHIVRADPAFRRIVDANLGSELREPADSAFEALMRAIVFQQLAGAAASTIHGRVITALGGAPVHPESVLAARPETLRAAGLSANKLAAVIDLAAKFTDGTVPTHDLDGLADDEIVERLVAVRGVGRWTAEMFLIFQLRRPNVWPVDDLGVRNGWARIHDLATAPTPKELAPLGDPLRPHRSMAAWYCWRAMAPVPLETRAEPAVKAADRPRPSRPKRA